MSISHQRMLSTYLTQAKSGDSEAFTELFNSLSMSTYYGVLRMVKDPDDAIALAKDVMLEVYRNIQHLSQGDELLAFVDRMVYLRSIDFLRKGQTLSYFPGGQEESTPEELEALLSTDTGDQAMNVEQVLGAIDRLPEQHRAIILLHYYNGYSVEEMSKILGWDEATTTSQFYRAHDALKAFLSNPQGGAIG